MKRFVNAIDAVLSESLSGFASAHPGLVTLGPENKFARLARLTPNKVALVSGGGSGHEPLHAGFVGYGMLDAACPGHVFTSPTPDQMAAAAEAVDGGAGVLFIVKDYSGDRMNFEMAAELVAMPVQTLTTDDDVAVESSTFSAGRRGVAGTLVVEKIVGRGGGSGKRSRISQAARRSGQCAHALDGRCLDELHGPRRRPPDFRYRREGNGIGSRHPRRAWPPPCPAHFG